MNAKKIQRLGVKSGSARFRAFCESPLSGLTGMTLRKMRAVWIIVVVAALALPLACSTGSSSDQQLPLAQCLPGWWLSLPLSMAPCLVCKGPMPPPECQFSDCAQETIEGFQAGGVYLSGPLTYSAQGRSMSGWVTGASYTITDGGYQIKTDPTIEVPSCTSSQRMDGKAILTRAPANLAAALDNATADGGTTWTSYPVGP